MPRSRRCHTPSVRSAPMKRLRLMVIGDLTWDDEHLIWEKLDQVRTWAPRVIIVEDGRPGPAEIAAEWADDVGNEVRTYEEHAFTDILQESRAKMVLAFGDSIGTRHRVQAAQETDGVSVTHVERSQ